MDAWKSTSSIGAVGPDHDDEQPPLDDKCGPLIDIEAGSDVAPTEPVVVNMAWVDDAEASSTPSSATAPTPKMAALYGVDRPFFHVDLYDALDSAVGGVRSEDEKLRRQEGIYRGLTWFDYDMTAREAVQWYGRQCTLE